MSPSKLCVVAIFLDEMNGQHLLLIIAFRSMDAHSGIRFWKLSHFKLAPLNEMSQWGTGT